MKLGDVADFIRNGVTISQNKDKNGLPITRIETIADRTINLDKCGYAGLRENDYSEYALQKGDILISHINSEKHLGKCAYFDLDDKVIHGMNLLCFRNKKDISDSKYLFHFLSSSAFLKQIPKITKKSVNQASFSISQFRDLDVYLPDLSTQTQIAKILDKSTALIAKRKAQIAELDVLVQSVFYNLFLADKKYQFVKLGQIADHISSGSTPKGRREVYKQSGIFFIRSQNVLMNEITYEDISFIDEATHNSMKRSQLRKNDVLLNITGASIGRVAVFEGEDCSANTNQHVAAIRISDESYLPYFISYFIASDYQQKIIKGICNGGTREALNYQQIRNFDIPQVPLEEQQFFLKVVKKIQTQKSQLQQSLTELEIQHQALMQRAFRGELAEDKTKCIRDKSTKVRSNSHTFSQTRTHYAYRQNS